MQEQTPDQKKSDTPTTVEEVVVNGFSWQVKPEKPKKFDPNDLSTLKALPQNVLSDVDKLNLPKYNFDVNGDFAAKEYVMKDPREAQMGIKVKLRESGEDLLSAMRNGDLSAMRDSSLNVLYNGSLLALANQAHNDERDKRYQDNFIPFDSLQPFSHLKPNKKGPSVDVPIFNRKF